MSATNEYAGTVAVKRRKRRWFFWRLLQVASVITLTLATASWISSYRNWEFHYYGGGRLFLRCAGVRGALMAIAGRTNQALPPGSASWGIAPANVGMYEHSPVTLPRFRRVRNWGGTSLHVACPAILLWAVAGVLPFTFLIVLPWAREALDPRDLEAISIDRTVPP